MSTRIDLVESLNEAIETDAFENLDQEVINKAVDNWMKRLLRQKAGILNDLCIC